MPALLETRQPRQQLLAESLMPQYYVPIPQRLICDMGRNQLAIGLYALIGRLWRAQADADGWVTLSTNDIMLFDPSLSRGAILRALTKLVRYGWIEAQPGRTKKKKRLRPAWGLVRGSIQPWAATAPILGRPKHIKTIRLDQLLLDAYIGRLTLRQTEPVIVDRYVAPMLSLEDVGAYASTLAGYPQPTTGLLQLGLVANDCVVAVPAISTILGQADEVTRRGIQRLGWTHVSDPQPPPALDQRPAVFFVAATMAGNIIRNMTRIMPGCTQRQESPNIPPVRDESAVNTARPDRTWMAWNTWNTWINPQQPVAGLMGGLLQGKNTSPKLETNEVLNPKPETTRRRGASSAAEIDIKTKAEQALMDAGIWSRTARTLREAPMTAVQYALERARAAQARDIPAYAVGLLSTLKEHQWQLPVAPPMATDTPDFAADIYAGFQRDPGLVAPDVPAVPVPAEVSPADWTPTTLWQAVQDDLRCQMTPAVFQATVGKVWLDQLNGSVVVLAAPTIAVRDAVTEQCVAPLKQSLARLLSVASVKLMVQLGTPAARPVDVSPRVVESVAAKVDADRPTATPPSRPEPAPAPAQPVETLPGTLAELLPALQQQLRYRAERRQQRELGLLASAIQAITVERETGDGWIELTPAAPTDLWRPEPGDQVVVTVGQSQRLEELVKKQCALLAEELGGLVDRRLTVADIVVRQAARGRPRHGSS